MYFNRRHQHVGHVFQDRFRASRIDSDSYFNWISVYIHANPKTAHLVGRLDDWPHSSYPGYIGKQENLLCDTSIIMSEFKSKEAYKRFVADGLGMAEKIKLAGALLDEAEES